MKKLKKIIVCFMAVLLTINLVSPIVSKAQTQEVQQMEQRTTLTVGDKITLFVNIENEGEEKISASWTSSNKAIATVSKLGVVTAKKAGTCTITATIKENNVSNKYQFFITVLKAPKSNSKITLKKNNHVKEFSADNTLSMDFYTYFPKISITDNIAATKQINAIISSIETEVFDGAEEMTNTLKQLIDSQEKSNKAQSYYCYLGLGYEGVYHQGNLLSLIALETIYVDNEDEEENYLYNGMNFDLTTGKEVTMKDLFTDVSSVRKFVNRSIIYTIKQKKMEDKFTSDYTNLINKEYSLQERNYYFTKDGMIVVINPYNVSSNLDETQEFTISYSKLSSYLSNYGKKLLGL